MCRKQPDSFGPPTQSCYDRVTTQHCPPTPMTLHLHHLTKPSEGFEVKHHAVMAMLISNLLNPAPEAEVPVTVRETGIVPPLNPQSGSSFFTIFPLEVRRNIYRQLWESCGIRQHIFATGDSHLAPQLTHAECITDPDARDIRGDEVHRTCPYDREDIPAQYDGPGDIDGAYDDITNDEDTFEDWSRRLNSKWFNHWACEERSRCSAASLPMRKTYGSGPNFHSSPFMATLLACKRMHEEVRESMYESLTFSFNDPQGMRWFLDIVPVKSLSIVQSVHVS